MMKKFLKGLVSLAIIYYILSKSVELNADPNTVKNDKKVSYINDNEEPFQYGDVDEPRTEVYCTSVTIRSVEQFNELESCTILTGYVHILEVVFTKDNLKLLKPSNIEEISNYLLVYRLMGLSSLEMLFPKLIVIRGTELFFDEYGLVVLENRDLQNIGLMSLLRVLKGSIRIENNPILCFVNTINWVWIMGPQKQYHIEISNNMPSSQCPLCFTYSDEREVRHINRHRHCWSHRKYQKTLSSFIGEQECPAEQQHCLTSCSDKKCRHCTNYVLDNACVDKCMPPKNKLAYKRHCLSSCGEANNFELRFECLENCPKFYEEVSLAGSNNPECVLMCKNSFVIHNEEDLAGIEECTTIDGSLTIEMRETGKPIIEKLENAFRNLQKISGYLKIVNSPQIISLHIFPNLHTIQGETLISNRYAVYIENNHYLQDLWQQNTVILNGCVYFNLNPRLCYHKITDLKSNFKGCIGITKTDAPEYTNGEIAVCGEWLKKFSANVTDVNSDSAVIEVSSIRSKEFHILIGYVYYYKEAPFKNVTRYEGRSGCGYDTWFTDISLKHHRRHILKNLRPGTQYAFFVNTMNFMDYPYHGEFISEIGYFKTAPAKPEQVARLFYHSISASEIEVHWWPPRITNGVVTHYLVQHEVAGKNAKDSEAERKVHVEADADTCECGKHHTESHVPTPHVEEFYNREKVLYYNHILNYVFVKKIKVNTTGLSPKVKRAVNVEYGNQMRWRRETGEDLMKRVHDSFEQKAKAKQDEDKESYVIPHPKPVCKIKYAQSEDCVPLEIFESSFIIKPNRHIYYIQNLKPQVTYRVSVRACVGGLENGCGEAKVIFAETMSKRLETIIEGIYLNEELTEH